MAGNGRKRPTLPADSTLLVLARILWQFGGRHPVEDPLAELVGGVAADVEDGAGKTFGVQRSPHPLGIDGFQILSGEFSNVLVLVIEYRFAVCYCMSSQKRQKNMDQPSILPCRERQSMWVVQTNHFFPHRVTEGACNLAGSWYNRENEQFNTVDLVYTADGLTVEPAINRLF